MTDISTTSWSEVDANNNQTPPEGWPAGMFPNAVEPSARMNMGAVKRFWDRANAVYPTTQSTADSYVVTPTQAMTGYGLYERQRLRFNVPNASSSPTLLFSSLPPQPLRKMNATSEAFLDAGDIQAHDHTVMWNGASFIVEDPLPAERNIPQIRISAAYTTRLSDNNKQIFHPSADTTARTVTVAARSSVKYPLGAALTFVNGASAGVLTLTAATAGTILFAGPNSTGTRTLSAGQIATAVLVDDTGDGTWYIAGTSGLA